MKTQSAHRRAMKRALFWTLLFAQAVLLMIALGVLFIAFHIVGW